MSHSYLSWELNQTFRSHSLMVCTLYIFFQPYQKSFPGTSTSIPLLFAGICITYQNRLLIMFDIRCSAAAACPFLAFVRASASCQAPREPCCAASPCTRCRIPHNTHQLFTATPHIAPTGTKVPGHSPYMPQHSLYHSPNLFLYP